MSERGKNLSMDRHKHVEGRCYARNNAAEKIGITESEFVYITEIVMKAQPGSLTTRAARLVLLEGKTQKQACTETGCSPTSLSTSLSRLRARHEGILDAYKARNEPKPQRKRLISILKRFEVLGVTDIDALLQVLETSGDLDVEKLLDAMELTRSLAS